MDPNRNRISRSRSPSAACTFSDAAMLHRSQLEVNSESTPCPPRVHSESSPVPVPGGPHQHRPPSAVHLEHLVGHSAPLPVIALRPPTATWQLPIGPPSRRPMKCVRVPHHAHNHAQVHPQAGAVGGDGHHGQPVGLHELRLLRLGRPRHARKPRVQAEQVRIRDLAAHRTQRLGTQNPEPGWDKERGRVGRWGEGLTVTGTPSLASMAWWRPLLSFFSDARPLN